MKTIIELEKEFEDLQSKNTDLVNRVKLLARTTAAENDRIQTLEYQVDMLAFTPRNIPSPPIKSVAEVMKKQKIDNGEDEIPLRFVYVSRLIEEDESKPLTEYQRFINQLIRKIIFGTNAGGKKDESRGLKILLEPITEDEWTQTICYIKDLMKTIQVSFIIYEEGNPSIKSYKHYREENLSYDKCWCQGMWCHNKQGVQTSFATTRQLVQFLARTIKQRSIRAEEDKHVEKKLTELLNDMVYSVEQATTHHTL